jgi:hypothetical protein
METKDFLDAIMASTDTLNAIKDGILGENRFVEHYYALDIQDGKALLNYEYYGSADKIPPKFIDSGLLCIHTHPSIQAPNSIIKRMKRYGFFGSALIGGNLISGTSKPSFGDMIFFAWMGSEIFGIASQYSNGIQLSAYKPDAMEGDGLVDTLKALSDADEMFDVGRRRITPSYVIKLMVAQEKKWTEDETLIKLMQPPVSSHLRLQIMSPNEFALSCTSSPSYELAIH